MSLASAWEDHAHEWISWARTSAHDGFWTGTSMHRPLSVYTSALFANGLAITALAEGGDGNLPWLLALGADKLPR